MPKIYSEEEKLGIRRRLKKEAAICMAQYGVKKTTVDELVVKAGIPKGTFYLFYESKEVLLFEVLLELHEKVEQKMVAMLEQSRDNLTPESLTELLVDMFFDCDNEPILKVIETDDMNLLMQRLPADVIGAHLEHDKDTLKILGEYLPIKENLNKEAITQALQAVFMMMVYLRNAPAINLRETIRVLVYGITLQLF